MPQDSPRRPGNPPPLPIAREEVAPNAVHEYRPKSFGERPTAPPPLPSRASRAEDGPPLERPRSKTLTGLPAPDSNRPPAEQWIRVEREDGERDSGLQAAESLAEELAVQSRRRQEAERALAESLASQASAVRIERSSEPATRADRELGRAVRILLGHVAKLLVAGLLGGGAAIVARPGANPERVDSQGVRLEAVERARSTDHDSELAQARYLQLLAVATDCRWRHIRAALEREGMTLESLPAGAVDWRSRYLPSGHAVHTTPEWLMSDDCPALPTPPSPRSE